MGGGNQAPRHKSVSLPECGRGPFAPSTPVNWRTSAVLHDRFGRPRRRSCLGLRPIERRLGPMC